MELFLIPVSVLIIIVTLGLFKIARFLRRQFISLHAIPGPPSTHWFWGNFGQLRDGGLNNIYEKWVAEYGSTFKFHIIFNVSTNCKKKQIRAA